MRAVLNGDSFHPGGAAGGGGAAPGSRRVYYPRPLIYIHLPKAGGTTLISALITRYRAGRGFRFTGLPQETEAFKALPERVRAQYDVLHGHVHFGIHKWLPDPATYATMLRDPVERIISYYYFVKTSPEHYLHEEMRVRGWTLEEFITQGTNWETDNDQVRWLNEPEHQEVRFGCVPRSMLEAAKWNLEHAFTVFGIVERFEESLECFRAGLGWPDLTCQRIRNVNTERPRAKLPRRTLEAIRRANRWDVELYEFACELFERQKLRLGRSAQLQAAPERAVVTAREVVMGEGRPA
jgi:hypothetical protein